MAKTCDHEKSGNSDTEGLALAFVTARTAASSNHHCLRQRDDRSAASTPARRALTQGRLMLMSRIDGPALWGRPEHLRSS